MAASTDEHQFSFSYHPLLQLLTWRGQLEVDVYWGLGSASIYRRKVYMVFGRGIPLYIGAARFSRKVYQTMQCQILLHDESAPGLLLKVLP
jgi:hypothetical protein